MFSCCWMPDAKCLCHLSQIGRGRSRLFPGAHYEDSLPKSTEPPGPKQWAEGSTAAMKKITL